MELTKRTELQLARQEVGHLVDIFVGFLNKIERDGADYAELKALLTILEAVEQDPGSDALADTLPTHIAHLMSTTIPDPLTLAEAASIYGVKADTLRRACWTGRLDGEKRGKTWFVRISDLEDFCS